MDIDSQTALYSFVMEILPNVDVSCLDKVLLKNGEVQVVPSATLKDIDYTHLRLWCHKHAVYGLPTTELIEFLKSIISGYVAIEVGAGNGVFGRALGIPSTDSMCQTNVPEIAAYYRLIGQPPVKYGDNVEELEASAAIDKYTPEVVFGSWVTQYISPIEVKPPPGGGSVYGLRESEFIKKIFKYVIFGNEDIHGLKLLLQDPAIKVVKHKNPDHFWSRATNHTNNTIYEISQASWSAPR